MPVWLVPVLAIAALIAIVIIFGVLVSQMATDAVAAFA
jgi:hypothetical protein